MIPLHSSGQPLKVQVKKSQFTLTGTSEGELEISSDRFEIQIVSHTGRSVKLILKEKV